MRLESLRRVSVVLPLCATLGGAALGCAGHPPPQATHGKVPPKLHPAELPPLEGPAAAAVPAYAVGTLDGDASPAALARRGTDGVAIYDHGGHLFAQRFDTKGGASGKPIDLGAHKPIAESGIALESRSAGYVLAWDEQVDENHELKVLGLDREGKPEGAVLSLPPIAERIALAGLLPAGDGWLLVHEVERDGASDVFATPLDPSLRRALSGPQIVAKGALGWNATHGDKEATFALVTGPAAKGEGEILGRVEVFGVDATGKKGASTVVASEPVADIDVEVATVEGTTLVAWTDHTDTEAAVRFATVKGGKLVVAPKRASTPLGEQALMGLVADVGGGAKRALIAWENVGEATGEARHVEVATVGADGRVSPERSTFLLDAQGRPDIVSDRDGFAVLTLAPAAIESDEPTGADAPIWPTYVRLGPDLSVRAAEPIRFRGASSRQGVPDLAHSLVCDAGDCTALAASSGNEAPLFVAVLPERTSPWRPVAWRSDGGAPPIVREVRSIFEGDSLAQVASVKLGGTSPATLATWVTYFVDGMTESEAPPKGEAPYAASLGVRAVRDDGALGEPVILSRRALSEGGVAIAEGPAKGRGEAIVAWVAAEKTGPQVYVTKVDADAKKVAQKKLTTISRSKGSGKNAGPTSGASSVAIAYAPAAAPAKHIEITTGKGADKARHDKPKKSADKVAAEKGASSGKSGEGFIVGWVDTRDKNGEVYVARINRELDKTVVDKRITNADGDASDVRILVHGSDTFVAYSDARGEEQGDIYVAHLDTQTLATIDAEGRVYASATHSRSPKLAAAGDHVLIAWIEEGAEADDGSHGRARLHVAELDPVGRLVSAPNVLDVPGSVTSFELGCAGATLSTCRGVATTELDGQVTLNGFVLGEDGAPKSPRRMYHLTTAALTDASPSFTDPTGGTVVLLEEAGRGRVRLMGIDW